MHYKSTAAFGNFAWIVGLITSASSCTGPPWPTYDLQGGTSVRWQQNEGEVVIRSAGRRTRLYDVIGPGEATARTSISIEIQNNTKYPIYIDIFKLAPASSQFNYRILDVHTIEMTGESFIRNNQIININRIVTIEPYSSDLITWELQAQLEAPLMTEDQVRARFEGESLTLDVRSIEPVSDMAPQELVFKFSGF